MDMMVIPNRGRLVAVISALALAVGLLTLALLAKPAQAQTNGAVSERFPIDQVIDGSACAGEDILVEGTLHTVNHFTLQDDGTYHVNSHFNFAGVKGVGLTSGDNYVVSASEVIVENRVQSGQIVGGIVDVTLVIGKGQLDNQVALALFHYIIDAEGNFKVDTVNFHFKCQG
jgi:hypothetical protein